MYNGSIKVMQPLTPEQLKDIQEREKKAIEVLQDLKLTPAAQIFYENNGTDGFITRVKPYLQDTKFHPQPVKSPFPLNKK